MRLSSARGASALAIAAVVVIALCACRPKSPQAPPAPVPPEPEVSASVPSAPAVVSPAKVAMAAPAKVPVVKSGAPDLSAMRLAERSSSKLGVPVDLRYQFDGEVEAGRPVTLHLAAVPRVPGSNLEVIVSEVAGVRATAAPLHAQKASAETPYRQALSVTREAGGPAELRVLVTMEMAEGSAHSFFSVPLVPQAAPAGKR